MAEAKFSIDQWLADYLIPANDELRDFWTKSLFDQVLAVPHRLRSGGRWRMNIRTMNLLRELLAPAVGYLVPLPHLSGAPELLIGYPIELDESAEGAVFETAEAVCRG